MRDLRWTVASTVFTVAIAIPLASNGVETLERFAGVWTGVGVVSEGYPTGRSEKKSGLDVAIWETDAGFTMSWRSPGGEGIRRMTSHFVDSKESGRFAAHQVAPPLSADQDLWAQVDENRMTVYLSHVVEAVERLARYRWSVANGTMTFKYTLSIDGEVTENVTGRLRRAKVVM